MKRKIYNFTEKCLKPNFVRSFIIFLIIVSYIIVQLKNDTAEDLADIRNWIDLKLFVLVLSFLVSELVCLLVRHIIYKLCEDSAKLSSNYSEIIKKYPMTKMLCDKMYKFVGNSKEEREEVYPVEVLSFITPNEKYEIIIEDNPDVFYNLPGQVSSNFQEIMKCHSKSEIYNQINIRLMDFIVYDNNVIRLVTGRTRYFDSLATNRAMDYKWNDGRTNRMVYEPGPYILPLCKSKLSNHLGFNGFVETSDGKIILIKRNRKGSIAKNTLACSVGASIKTKYAICNAEDLKTLKDKKMYEFFSDGLTRSVKYEIKNELNIETGFDEIFGENSPKIFAFYRDLVEGGKPQFLFYSKIQLDSKIVLDYFEKYKNKISSNMTKKENKTKNDGKKIYLFDIKEVLNSFVSVDRLEIKKGNKNLKFKIVPSVAASFVLLKRYIGSDNSEK